MNSQEVHPSDSKKICSHLAPLKNVIGIAVAGCLVSCADTLKFSPSSSPDTSVMLPFGNIDQLRKNPGHEKYILSPEMEQLSHFFSKKRPPIEYVDDNGNVLPWSN